MPRRFHPPVLALWLLRHLGPHNHSENLAGDLLETFREGRSTGWFWRQVLIAIGVAQWRPLVYGTAGTVMLAAAGMGISALPRSWLARLWIWGQEFRIPLFDLAQALIASAIVLPLFVILFGRAGVLRVFLITVPLIVAGGWVTTMWLATHPASSHAESAIQVWALRTFGISRIFLTLLVSAWAGSRRSLKNNSCRM